MFSFIFFFIMKVHLHKHTAYTRVNEAGSDSIFLHQRCAQQQKKRAEKHDLLACFNLCAVKRVLATGCSTCHGHQCSGQRSQHLSIGAHIVFIRLGRRTNLLSLHCHKTRFVAFTVCEYHEYLSYVDYIIAALGSTSYWLRDFHFVFDEDDLGSILVYKDKSDLKNCCHETFWHVERQILC